MNRDYYLDSEITSTQLPASSHSDKYLWVYRYIYEAGVWGGHIFNMNNREKDIFATSVIFKVHLKINKKKILNTIGKESQHAIHKG